MSLLGSVRNFRFGNPTDIRRVAPKIDLSHLAFTPDIGKLEEHQWQLFFIYDNMKQEHQDYSKIKENSYSFEMPIGFTQDKFVMFKRCMGLATYPFILQNKWMTVPNCRVKGELHYIETGRIPELDTMRQNGVEYKRRKIKILLPYHVNKPVFTQAFYVIKAWTYVGISEFWEEDIADIDRDFNVKPYASVGTFQANRVDIGRYYSFEKKDYGVQLT